MQLSLGPSLSCNSQSGISSISWVSPTSFLTGSSDGSVDIWDVKQRVRDSGEEDDSEDAFLRSRSFDSLGSGVVCTAYHQPTDTAVVTSQQGDIHLFSLSNQNEDDEEEGEEEDEHAVLYGGPGEAWSLDISPSSASSSFSQIATGSFQGEVHLWRMDRREKMATLALDEDSFVLDTKYHPRGLRLLTATASGSLTEFDINRETILHTQAQAHAMPITTVAYSSAMDDGRIFLSGSHDGAVHMYDSRTSHLIHVFRGHTGWVNHLQFPPPSSSQSGLGGGSSSFVSCSSDLSVCVWDVRIQEPIRSFHKIHSEPINKLAFSPPSSSSSEGWSTMMLSCGEDGVVRGYQVQEDDV